MKSKLHRIIEDNWPSIDDGSVYAQINFIILDKVVLVFKSTDVSPFVVLKISRYSTLEKEFANLKKIHSLLPDITPSPLFFDCSDNLYVFGQSCVAGVGLVTVPLTASLIRSCFGALSTFHRSVMKGTFTFDTETLPEMLHRQRNQFEKINPELRDIRGYKEHVTAIAFSAESFFPMIPQHGDFSLVNLVYSRENDQMSIIDWADFGKTCLPLYDVFLLMVSNYLGRVSCEELLQQGIIEKVFVECLHEYLEEFEIRAEDIGSLFVVFIITFFNQNYLAGREETAGKIYDLFICYLKNHDRIFFTA